MDLNTIPTYPTEESRTKTFIKLAFISLIPISYIVLGSVNWSSCSVAYQRIIFANTFAIIWSILALIKRRHPFCCFMFELQLITVLWAIHYMNVNDPEKDALDPRGRVFLMASYVFFTIALWVHTFLMGILMLIFGSIYLYYLANPHLLRRPHLGLNDEEIENLPFKKFDHQEITDPTSPRFFKECVICLEHFKQDEEVTELPSCTHSFHKGCIVEWVKKQPHCPYCRNNIRDSLSNSPTIAASPNNNESPVNFNRQYQSDRQVRISVNNSTASHHRNSSDPQPMALPAYAELQEF